ncbi:MAG: GDP-mannose 4,6-dehydratase [Candidatus Pacearchaeota archaeon]
MRKKALITGITGQIGSYLAELLVEKGYEVYGLVRTSSTMIQRKRIDHLQKKIKLVYGDLSDTYSIERAIESIEPDEVYNLAAQSHVGISFNLPELTSDVCGIGVLRICEALKKLKKKTKLYQASTSELYGGIYDFPVNESVPFNPKSPYAISKLYAYWIIKHYRETYKMFCCNGILFNTESPRRGENFVTRKITIGVSEIAKGKRDCIYLGNLNARRDWGHAKDAVRAMWAILQAENPDDYVIATGETHSVREFVEEAFKHIGVEISWRGEGLEEEGYDSKTGKVYVKVDSVFFEEEKFEKTANINKIKSLSYGIEYSF